MQIETARFGQINIDENSIITFPDGLPGFEEKRRFAFVSHPSANQDKSSPFLWLQSLEDEKLAFLTAEPRHFFPGYAPRIASADLDALEIGAEPLGPRLYTLLTVPSGDPIGITANLLAPIAINPVAHIARQVIVAGDDYGLRHRLLPAEESTAPQSREVVAAR
ncbi:MAG: fliW [Capsulimonas sp.]|jgi:flagellar assembly factor FliW|nr:fliW [Capsulimonas sp.]